MKAFKLSLLALCTCFMACTDDTPELSDVVIFVTPAQDVPVSLSSGDKYRYDLEMSTIHDYVANFSIKSFDNRFGNITHIDTVCNQKNINYSFLYTAPELDRDSIDVELKFRVADNLGNNVEISRTVHVKNKLISITEKTGIVLYNPHIGLPDALSLDDVSQPFILAGSPDSLSADIYIESDIDFTSVSWKSKTKAKFIRNNTFNYVEATADRINSVYQSSIRQDRISDLRSNDIIIVGHGDRAQGVFHVRNIIRSNTVGNVACMQLSFKGIKH